MHRLRGEVFLGALSEAAVGRARMMICKGLLLTKGLCFRSQLFQIIQDGTSQEMGQELLDSQPVGRPVKAAKANVFSECGKTETIFFAVWLQRQFNQHGSTEGFRNSSSTQRKTLNCLNVCE